VRILSSRRSRESSRPFQDSTFCRFDFFVPDVLLQPR
jgi:hypothetical protein